jgi:hypothetical protein
MKETAWWLFPKCVVGQKAAEPLQPGTDPADCIRVALVVFTLGKLSEKRLVLLCFVRHYFPSTFP